MGDAVVEIDGRAVTEPDVETETLGDAVTESVAVVETVSLCDAVTHAEVDAVETTDAVGEIVALCEHENDGDDDGECVPVGEADVCPLLELLGVVDPEPLVDPVAPDGVAETRGE